MTKLSISYIVPCDATTLLLPLLPESVVCGGDTALALGLKTTHIACRGLVRIVLQAHLGQGSIQSRGSHHNCWLYEWRHDAATSLHPVLLLHWFLLYYYAQVSGEGGEGGWGGSPPLPHHWKAIFTPAPPPPPLSD